MEDGGEDFTPMRGGSVALINDVEKSASMMSSCVELQTLEDGGNFVCSVWKMSRFMCLEGGGECSE